MDDLIAFVKARLDEDELAAKIAAVDGAWGQLRSTIPPEPGPLNRNHRLMEAFNPARVLREVAAKRAILGRHMPHQPAFGGLACNWCSDDTDDRPQIAKEPWPCPDVRSLAAVWSDHADYRQEWAPEVSAGPASR